MFNFIPKRLFSARNLQLAVLIVLALLVITVISFGGYYYWDRYVHLEDKSVIELGTEHLEQAIRDDPQNPEPRIALAQFYLDQGLYQEALEQTNQVLNSFPEHEGALLFNGIAYVRLDQPGEAIEPLEKFAEMRKGREMAGLDDHLERAYYFLGESYLKLDQPAAAISVLEEALIINRTDADALYQLGLAYHANGQPEQALERYHRAVRLVPNFTEAYRGMLESYTALGQSDHVAYARGMEALTLEDYRTAQTQLEQAAQALPDFAPAFLGLGLTYEKLKQFDAALAAVERGLEIAPNDFVLKQAQGRLQAIMTTQQKD